MLSGEPAPSEPPPPGASVAETTLTPLVDERLPVGRTLILGLQHVLIMYTGAVAIPLILGNALGLSRGEIAFLISADLLTCGLATLLQTLGLTRYLGVRLPVVLGVTFVALKPMITIGKESGLPTVYGAIILSGILAMLVAPYFSRLRRLFPPLVVGCLLVTIGISLLPVSLNWAGGGTGAPDFGAPRHLGLALFTLAVITALQRWQRGFVSNIAVLLGLVAGSGLALALGRMNLSAVAAEPWFALTTPLRFGVPRFELGAVLKMSLVVLICMVESTGVFLTVSRLVGQPLTDQRLGCGLRAEGLAMVLGGVLNSFPYVTYSQNVGLVALTGVRSRYAVAAGGGILVLLGLLPRFAAVVAAIPPAVLGGAGVVLFGMVATAGIQTLATLDFRRPGNLYVAAVAIALGVGVSMVPQLGATQPAAVRWLLSDGVLMTTVVAVLLNLFLNGVSKNS